MEYYGITDYFAYLLGVIAIILLPGPNSMYCLFVGSAQGVKQGYKTVAAILIGDTLLMMAAVLGAATILKSSANLFILFKGIGGLYLLYLGAMLLKSAYQTYKTSKQLDLKSVNDIEGRLNNNTVNTVQNVEKANVFLKAFLLSLSNPKAILFFLSYFLQFVDPAYSNPMLSFTILGATLQVVSFLYLSTLIFSGQQLVSYFKNHLFFALLGQGLVGLLFVSFAMSLWLATM